MLPGLTGWGLKISTGREGRNPRGHQCFKKNKSYVLGALQAYSDSYVIMFISLQLVITLCV